MTSTNPRVRVYGVLPAAGMSRRMGTAKQVLPYGDRTMTARTAHTMLESGLDAVAVVTRTELVEAIHLPQDDRLLLVVNDDASSQMIDSIGLGMDRLDDVFGPSPQAGILVIPADMPTVSTDACTQCIEAFRRNPSNVFIATYDGKRGHPVLFPAALRRRFSELTGGLSGLLRLRADLVREVVVDNSGVLRDVDTPADYNSL